MSPVETLVSETEIADCNATGRTPVVFIHGLWLLPSSWERWAEVFEQAGYAPLLPGWPDDPDTVAEANANPEVFAHKTVGQVADHYAEVIGELDRKPVVIGHSFGGLLTQIIAGRGLSAASVAIDPAPFRGVLPLPDLGAEVGLPGARQPGQPQPRRPAHLRPVPLRLRECRRRGRGEGALRDLRRSRGGRAALPGCDGQPQSRGPRRRSTARTPSAARS